MAKVEFPELPKCDVCKELNLPKPMPATGDSAIARPGKRRTWGYTCDHHAFLRVGEVTELVEATP